VYCGYFLNFVENCISLFVRRNQSGLLNEVEVQYQHLKENNRFVYHNVRNRRPQHIWIQARNQEGKQAFDIPTFSKTF